MESIDKLNEAALAFENLLYKEYNFIVARKAKAYNINLTFEKSDYFHLAGLHKANHLISSQSIPKAVFI